VTAALGRQPRKSRIRPHAGVLTHVGNLSGYRPCMAIDADAQREQLATQRRKVDFDSYDITVDELVRRVTRKRIEIAPAYQRQFRWDD
jgi:hypothetical protein